ncbi:MAG TPA: SdrD B-like domain-containing protein, partial [Herbaspirillum sp.]
MQAHAALVVSMSVAETLHYPNPIFPGDVTAYEITLSNDNTSAAVTNVNFTDTMRDPVTMVDILVAGVGVKSFNCTAGDGVTPASTAGAVSGAVVGSNVVTLSNATVPPAGAHDGVCKLIVEVTAFTQGAPNNVIPAHAVTGDNPSAIDNGSQAIASITVLGFTAPNIDKSFSKTSIVKLAEPTRLSIVITNKDPGPLPLNGVGDSPAYAIQDNLAVASLKVATPPNASSTCTGGGTPPAFSPAADDTILTAAGGTVAAGVNNTCTLSVDLVGTSNGAAYGTEYTNTIDRTTNFHTKRGLPAVADATATVTVTSVLQVGENFALGTIAQGQQSTLTVTLTNAGIVPITLDSYNQLHIDGLADSTTYGLTLVGGTSPPMTNCPGANVMAVNSNRGFNLTGGSLAAGTSCTITIPFKGTVETAGTPKKYDNPIAASAVVTTDPNIHSNSAIQSVNVVDVVTIDKSVSPTTVAPGSPVKYQLTLKNFTTADITSASITDALPSGMILLSTLPAPPSVSTVCGTLSVTGTPTVPVFNIPTVPAGTGAGSGACTVTFWAMVPKGAGAVGVDVSNTIAANGVTGNGGTLHTQVGSNASVFKPQAGLTVSESFSPNAASENTVSVLSITLTNISANALTNAAFTDALPLLGSGAQLRIANPAAITNTCGGTVTAPADGTAITLAGATVPARGADSSGVPGTGTFGSCVITVKVIGPAGNFINLVAATATENNMDGSSDTITASATTNIDYADVLAASKSFLPTTISSGGRSTVRVHLVNSATGAGAVPLNNVRFTDALPNVAPSTMTIASPANAYTTCGGSPVVTAAPGATSASVSGIVMPAGNQCDVLFDVIATGTGGWTNTLGAGAIVADGGVQNLTAVTADLGNTSAGTVSVTNNMTPNSLTAPGQVSVLSALITNGSVPLTGLKLADYFTVNGQAGGTQTGLQLAAEPQLHTDCPNGIVTAGADGASFFLTNATLAASGTCRVFANVTLVSTTGTVQNTIPTGFVLNNEGITNTSSTVTSLSSGGNLGVIKRFTPAAIKPSDRSRLRLTFVNPLTVAATSLTADDTLPTGMTIPAGPNPITTCTGATVTFSNGSPSQIHMAGGSLPAADASGPTSCYLEIDVTATDPGSYVNTIQSGQVHATSGSGNVSNSDPSHAVLDVHQPVTVTKSFSPANVQPGVPSTLTIVVSNPNTDAIPFTGAALTDVLPTNVTVAPTPNASTTCASGLVTAPVAATSVILTGATLAPNTACLVKVDVVSNIAGVYVNTIPVGSVTTQQGVTNTVPANATLSLLDPPTVNKQFAPIAISPGAPSTLTITLGNTNSTALTLTSALVDTLPTSPANIVVANPAAIGGTCVGQGTITAPVGGGTVTYASGGTIPAGGCTITVNVTGSVQGEYINVIPSGALQTASGSNVQQATAPLEISPLGAISGQVFKDNSIVPNGTFELGTDTPLASQTIQLTGTGFGPDGIQGNGDDAAVSLTTTTNALGNYAFVGLNAGRYTVTQPNQPAGTVDSFTRAGTVTGGGSGNAPGSPSAVGTSPSTIANIVLTKSGGGTVAISPDNNFSEVVLSSISGSVFLDQNNSGVHDLEDSALSGVTIKLSNSANSTVLTTTTDANGAYSFTNLLPGTYALLEPTQPTGTANGKTIAGTSGGTPTAVGTVPSAITTIVLPPATSSTGNNFAELPTGHQISGRVFGDVDNNGLFDTTDAGLAGVTMTLTGVDVNGQTVTPQTTTTDATGRYLFIGLVDGTYVVTEPTQPPRTANGITTAGSTGGTATAVSVPVSVISAIPLTAGISVSSDNNFAETPIPTGTLSGKVYIDTNDNGIIDSGEQGVNETPGVTITLTGTEADNTTPFTATVHTLADGSYSFPNVPPSNAAGYTITELQPALYKDGKTTVAPGNPGTPASSKPVLSNNIDIIRGVVVLAGDVLPNYNFGELPLIGPGLIPPIVNGYVYLDKDHDRTRDNDGTSIGQPNWTVNLTENGTQICTTTTDAAGFYQFDNLHCPGYEGGLPTGPGFKITFTKDGNSLPAVPTSGGTRGNVPNGGGVIDNITLTSADQVIEQDLPLDPSGVIYDSSSRTPVAGAVISITGPAGFDAATQLVGGLAAQTQTVGSDGFYQFLLENGFPQGIYTLSVTSPGGYAPAPSTVLPPCSNAPLVVSGILDPALVQASNTAPSASAPQPANLAACQGLVSGGSISTQYYFSFVIDHTSANILNNHIPLDPANSSEILVTKTTPLVNVSRGDLVPYTITATNTVNRPLNSVAIRDQLPPGFKYRLGSASLNGVNQEPTVNGRVLTWPAQGFAAKEKKTYRLILQVGSGVGDGKYVNQGFAISFPTGFMLSNLATATVNVVPDPTFDCPDVIGKVFDDQNANGYQDQGEPGIPAVRIATARGLLVMTDAEGRFHVPCPEIPNEDRGSNFVMKLDPRTLPSGYRITTENPRDIRLTRGKVSKLNFGATIHRVVRLELGDSAF